MGVVGGFVFFGDDDGHPVAVDARTGKHPRLTQTGEPFVASSIFTFGLFEPVISKPFARPKAGIAKLQPG